MDAALHTDDPQGGGARTRSLSLFAQPIEPLHGAGGMAPRYELLLRVLDENGVVEGPSRLLAALERDGLGNLLDRFVLGSFLAWLSRHPGQAGSLGLCFVNLTADSLLDRRWFDELAARLHRESFPVEKLCFEISERVPLERFGVAAELVRDIRALGCRVAIDDFGRSNASFQLLRAIPCDYVKIDGDLVRGIDRSSVDRSIIESIAALGHSLERKVIAECVESRRVRHMLAQMGIDYGQGFHLGPPRPIQPGLIGLH